MLTLADLARATERVFPTHARVERYYPAPAAEEARGVLGRCLDRGEGPALLIGTPGTGKSMLLNVLADDLGQNRPVVCLTSAQLCTRRALLQSILFELGQSYRQRDEGDLRLSLMDYLRNSEVAQTGVLLLVDEAQSLPIRLLEELRILGNVAHRGVPVIRLLLAGSQPLEETFTEPEVEAFNQRIAARCYLSPLGHADVAQYVRGHLAAAGASPDQIFAADALDAVYRATDGIARIVNQVCDRAIVLAAEARHPQVTKQCVEAAWADLQQLPTPWNLPDSPETAAPARETSSVVEFGTLADEEQPEEVATDLPTVEKVEQLAPAPTAKIHQPEAEREVAPVDEAAEIADEWETIAELPAAPKSQVATLPVATRSYDVTPAGSLDDLFGGDEFEEELVINEFASLEQTIPARRPRVTSACDAQLGTMLEEVLLATDAESAAVLVADREEPQPAPFAGFGIVDHEEHDDEELALDGTELDDEEELGDEVDEVLSDVRAIAEETHQVVEREAPRRQEAVDWSGDELDMLVIEDEMSLPLHTAAASRADYRQLFKTLRNN